MRKKERGREREGREGARRIFFWTFSFVLEYSRLTGEGDGTPPQYSCLENPMDRGAWWAAVHGVAEGETWLSNFTFTLHFHALEKEMATHSSVLACRIPGTGEPGGLPSMGSHRVIHDWSDLAAAAAVAACLCLLVGTFNPFTFKVIINIYVPIAMFLIVWAWFCRSSSFSCVCWLYKSL